MLKIENGKVYGSNFSFDLPKGFNREKGLRCFRKNDLVFRSLDNEYLHLVIYFEKECHSAKNDMQAMFNENRCLIKMGDFVSVKRGAGVAVGLFYENTFGATQHYGERYDFKKNKYGVTQIFIDVSLWSGRGEDRQTIQEAVKLPQVKAFLESIEYF